MTEHWDDYRVLLAVLRAGGVTLAAPGLELVPATIKRSLERLDQAWGRPLLTSAGGRLEATSAGLEAKSLAERLEAGARAFAGAARAERRLAEGRVAVTASGVLLEFVIIPALGEVRARHPKLCIDTDGQNGLATFIPGAADIGVVAVKPVAAGLIVERLGAAEFGIFARRDLLDRFGRPSSVGDLYALPFIGPSGGGQQQALLTHFGVDVGKLDRRLLTGNFSVLFAAIRAGVGVGVFQAQLADRFPELERVLPRLGAAFPVWLVIDGGQAEVRRVAVVADAVRAAIGRHLDQGVPAMIGRARGEPS